MSQRREVRVSEAFFNQLDAQLSAERGPRGQPSATDFLVMELPAVVERFATDFDGLPEIVPGVEAGRMFISVGVIVRAAAVYGILLADGAVELIGLEIDR